MAADEGGDNKTKAESLKNEGNTAFGEHHYEKAIDLYTQAIGLYGSSAVYYSNRAQAHLRLESFGAALADADKAIELDPTYEKAYFRRGSAHLGLRKWKDAVKDFQAVVKLKPRDASARDKLKQCQDAVKRIAFEEAIACEETAGDADPFGRQKWETIAVEGSYSGPRIGETITREFILELIEHQRDQKKLHTKFATRIICEAAAIFDSEPTLVHVGVPEGSEFTVCGDVHGQYYDMLNIFALNGHPAEDNPYLFNGDFVDRGSFGIEVILVMFAFKWLYPRSFFMSRGNHESKNMNQMYGFYGEVKAKYNGPMVGMFERIFNLLPLCTVINKKVMVVHGGLFSKDGVTLDDIAAIDRRQQPPESPCLMSEMLWADPQPYPGRGPSKRGVGSSFGPDVTKRFLDDNGLTMLVRSHEVKEQGYEVEADGRLVTVFSAPNYCDQVGNKGAFVRFNHEMVPRYTSFAAVPHPPIRPMAYSSLGLGSFL